MEQYFEVQDQPDLIGHRAAAGGAVGCRLGFVKLDEVFGLATVAVDRLVQVDGTAEQRRHDVSVVEPLGGGFQPGDDLALGFPALGAVADFAVGAQLFHPLSLAA